MPSPSPRRGTATCALPHPPAPALPPPAPTTAPYLRPSCAPTASPAASALLKVDKVCGRSRRPHPPQCAPTADARGMPAHAASDASARPPRGSAQSRRPCRVCCLRLLRIPPAHPPAFRPSNRPASASGGWGWKRNAQRWGQSRRPRHWLASPPRARRVLSCAASLVCLLSARHGAAAEDAACGLLLH